MRYTRVESILFEEEGHSLVGLERHILIVEVGHILLELLKRILLGLLKHILLELLRHILWELLRRILEGVVVGRRVERILLQELVVHIQLVGGIRLDMHLVLVVRILQELVVHKLLQMCRQELLL